MVQSISVAAVSASRAFTVDGSPGYERESFVTNRLDSSVTSCE
jgi:hypothetical protein